MMLGNTEFEVCVDCGLVHMEGGEGPHHVDECSSCGGHLDDIELDDLIGL